MTFEITVSSPEAYLSILEALDAAVAGGAIDVEFELKPALSALPVLAAHALDQEHAASHNWDWPR